MENCYCQLKKEQSYTIVMIFSKKKKLHRGKLVNGVSMWSSSLAGFAGTAFEHDGRVTAKQNKFPFEVSLRSSETFAPK